MPERAETAAMPARAETAAMPARAETAAMPERAETAAMPERVRPATNERPPDPGRGRRVTVWTRSAPVLCGIGLTGAAGYLATHDPAAAGSPFPGCPFHATTGLWCPGCGLTRATHTLLRGDVLTALGANVFTPLALVLIAGSWWGWLRRAWDRPPARRTADRVPGWLTNVGVVALVLFGVARNLPWAPLRALAP